jgi:Protein of unknown function (DUF1566)
MKTILRLFVLFGFILVIPSICSFSQVGINTDNTAPDNSAMLDVKSTTKGFLPPRMTLLQRNAIPSPAAGLIVYCTDCNDDGSGVISIYLGDKWKNIMIDCIPSAPTEGTHVPTSCQITWNWNAVDGATGYRAGGENNYATSGDMGNVTTATQTGCTPNTPYTAFVWAYNGCGASTATTMSSTTTAGGSLCIGQYYEGGIIFYIDGTGLSGLIAAESDQSTGAQWGCDATHIVTGEGIGSGQTNTTNIVSGCSTAGIAARICDQLDLNGYTDWFLPSKDEINQMYIQKDLIGGFGDGYFWCSTESPSETATAYYDHFDHGGQGWTNKYNSYRVRAIRAF